MNALLAFALAWLFGWLLVQSCWPAGLRQGTLVLRLALAHGLGVAATATLWFLHLVVVGQAAWPAVVGAELGLVAVLAVVVRRRARAGAAPGDVLATAAAGGFTRALLAVVVLAAVVSFALATAANPQGVVDALTIWNMRAQLLWDSGPDWPRALAAEPSLHHVDYPLLLPLAVARGWQFAGAPLPFVPATLAAAFTFATAAVCWGVLRVLRGGTAAAAAAATLLGGTAFVAVGATQYADVPLAFFAVAALALVQLHREHPAAGPGLLVLAGACAASAAWTKNEGLLFAIVFGAAMLLASWRARTPAAWRRLLPLAAGALPVLAALVWFKVRLVPTNDLVAQVAAGNAWQRLLTGERWITLLRGFARTAWSLGPAVLVALGGWAVLCRRQRAWLPLGVAAAVLAGYFATYLGTSVNLEWHLGTSCQRLLVHVLPLVVLGVCAGRAAR